MYTDKNKFGQLFQKLVNNDGEKNINFGYNDCD